MKEDIDIENIEELYQFLLPKRRDRMDQVLNKRTNHLTLLLENVHNYHNISAVLRSADAFGLCDVHLIGKNFEYSKGIALGSEQWLKLHIYPDAKSALIKLRSEGYKIVVTAPEENLEHDKIKPIPVFELPFEEKLVLAFGNERLGLSDEIFKEANYKTFIPMFGFVESFNISVACALCLFCSTVKVSSGERQTPLLDEKEKENLRSQWLMKTLPNSQQILREISRRKSNKSKET